MFNDVILLPLTSQIFTFDKDSYLHLILGHFGYELKLRSLLYFLRKCITNRQLNSQKNKSNSNKGEWFICFPLIITEEFLSNWRF